MARSESIVLGGGCFWCTEAAYQLINGVTKVTSGYAGGPEDNPSYFDVAYGRTGHAEVVKVDFDPQVISLADILDIFWAVHDPTTPDRQGNDSGPQYRSIILYNSDEQKELAEKSRAAAAAVWDDPIVTEIKPLETFYEAEEYQQNFFNNHPEQAYCQVIINPKLKKLREKYAAKLKQD